ncbi:MAG: helix-turn-helix domain-containing protein [Phycisphaerae bacterium]|nr:helix-turn-helix domain-containing protein [Phycisphaerae bacterium]
MASVISSLRLQVLVAERVSLDSSWAPDSPYNNPFARLYWVISGTAGIRHHDREYPLEPRRLYLIPANTSCWFGRPRRMRKDYVHFTSDVLGRTDWLDRLGCSFDVTPEDPKHIQDLFTRLIRVFNSDSPGRMLESDGLLRQLLVPFFRTISAGQQDVEQRRERFDPVLSHIEEHLSARPTLAELAEHVHLQPTYFSNLFREVMGSPPMQYISRRRVERAQAMLWYESTPIKHVARQLGFSDVFHFTRVFKQITGLSPGAFRKQKRRPLP